MITKRGRHREQRQAVSQGGHLLTTRTVLTQYTCIIFLQHIYEYGSIYTKWELVIHFWGVFTCLGSVVFSTIIHKHYGRKYIKITLFTKIHLYVEQFISFLHCMNFNENFICYSNIFYLFMSWVSNFNFKIILDQKLSCKFALTFKILD